MMNLGLNFTVILIGAMFVIVGLLTAINGAMYRSLKAELIGLIMWVGGVCVAAVGSVL